MSSYQSFISSLSETRIRDVLARVDDQELNASTRKSLTDLLRSLKQKQGRGRLTRAQEQVAFYFQMLAETHDRISNREKALQNLAKLLNQYIGPSKQASYDSTRYKFIIRVGDLDVPLSGLSSGEKQIVSLFATLSLSGWENHFVVIDEPELSLSVLWQERLLEDIHSVPACQNIMAVTHSPFIYGEKLARFTRDLSDHTSLTTVSHG